MRHGNPLAAPLVGLISRANELAGQLSILCSEIKRKEMRVKKGIRRRQDEGPTVLRVQTLLIWLFEDPRAGAKPRMTSCGTFRVSDESYVGALQDLLRRKAAYSVAQCYEAFETFLIDTLAWLLHLDDGRRHVPIVKKATRKHPAPAVPDQSYWRKVVKCIPKGEHNQDLLDMIRDAAPIVPLRERPQNGSRNLGLDFVEWIPCVAEVRHAATHADGIIRSTQIKDWAESCIELLRTNLPVVFDSDHDGYRLSFTELTAQRAMRHMLEYAVLIYQGLSVALNLRWDAPPPWSTLR